MAYLLLKLSALGCCCYVLYAAFWNLGDLFSDDLSCNTSLRLLWLPPMVVLDLFELAMGLSGSTVLVAIQFSAYVLACLRSKPIVRLKLYV